MLAGGMSVFSIVQLLSCLLRVLIPLNNNSEIKVIPSLGTRNVFHALSDKLYHLKKDFIDFVRMSSIHGVRNLTGSFRENIFWLAVISVATVSCVHFVGDLFKGSSLNEVVIELDDEVWSVDEVHNFF